uniref:CHK kinase-like domain-containing protein n=1 Tax=Lygus hesperus TaxID=30085 RepID=A0A0A9WQH8_LYGHE
MRLHVHFAMEDHGLDTKLLASFLKKSYHDAKPAEIVSADVKLAVPKGDNYGSTVFRVTFLISTASGKKKKHSIIIKTIAGWTEVFSGVARNVSPVFRSEITVYNTIFPLMEALMEEFGDRRTKLWSEMIGYSPYNMIAFEDLNEDLHFGLKRKNCVNLKESLLLLRSLGRFHAMSKVLIARGYITEKDKGQIMLSLDTEFIEKLWEAYFTVLSNAMEDWGQEWKDISKKLSQLRKGVNKRWAEIGETYDKRFEVFNHGDLWTCNLLFKNMEFEEIPISVKFVDFQCCHINSFIWDVDYFLYSSTIASVRRANMELLHSAYQESLEKNLKFFNYDGYIPTLEDVKAESKRIEFVGMCTTFFQPIMVSEKQLDLAKVMTHSPEHVIDKSVYTDGKAKEILGEDLKKFYENGVLSANLC